jgi:hypothetical protein
MDCMLLSRAPPLLIASDDCPGTFAIIVNVITDP